MCIITYMNDVQTSETFAARIQSDSIELAMTALLRSNGTRTSQINRTIGLGDSSLLHGAFRVGRHGQRLKLRHRVVLDVAVGLRATGDSFQGRRSRRSVLVRLGWNRRWTHLLTGQRMRDLKRAAHKVPRGNVQRVHHGRRRNVHDIVAPGPRLEILVAEVVQVGEVGLKVQEASRRYAAVAEIVRLVLRFRVVVGAPFGVALVR